MRQYFLFYSFSHLHPFHWNKPRYSSAFHSWSYLKVKEEGHWKTLDILGLVCLNEDIKQAAGYFSTISNQTKTSYDAEHRLSFQDEISAFFANTFLRVKHKPTKTRCSKLKWVWSRRTEKTWNIWALRSGSQISVDQPHFTPPANSRSLWLCKAVDHKTASSREWEQAWFSFLSTGESSRK